MKWIRSNWFHNLTAVITGALLPLSLAPFKIWPLGIISPVILAYLLVGTNGRVAFVRGFLFGLGLFSVGASWVFRSINDFGFASLPLALVLTALFVTGLALASALPFLLYGRYCNRNHWALLPGFACIWTLGEWARSWFLTGFPWLYVGYAHSDTWLAGWAPLVGVFGLSFLSVLSGLLVVALIQNLLKVKDIQCYRGPAITLLSSAVALWAIWGGGYLLSFKNWTEKKQETPISVAIVQPNIPQPMKWQPFYYPYIMQTLRDLTRDSWGADLIVWPENAVPLFYHDADVFLEEISLRAQASDSGLITGILYDADTPRTWYNAIIGIGNARGTYFKQRLVPFGEYVPLENFLRGTLAFFDLPNSLISPGEADQKPLSIADNLLATSICYEVVYPSLVASYARDAALLVTISNDAWFGDSIGPIQHFQMARMRALENGKYLLRATNTGISGVVSDKGKTLSTLPQFSQGTLAGEVYLMSGHTPFSRWKSWPIVIICLIGVFAGIKRTITQS